MTKSYKCPFRRKMGLLFALVFLPLAMQAAIINVSTSSELASAVAGANPGDTIVLANGNYSGFTITRSGNVSAPIVIQAANVGGAVITSGSVQLSQVSYVDLDGINFTTSGGSANPDGTTIYFAVLLLDAKNCRVTRGKFDLTSPHTGTGWVTLENACMSNEIDHCEFGPNHVGSHSHYIFPTGNPTITNVVPPSDRTSWAHGNGPVNPAISRYTEIDYNYFHDQGTNDGETIALGAIGVTGDYQGTHSTVEHNLFVNCDGDPEIITTKSSTNTLCFNTVQNSEGVFSLRSGNSSSVCGNFFFCAGSGSGGVKLSEMHHKVYNNYITTTHTYPIMCENGDPYSTNTFSHAQVVDAEIEYNTIVSPNYEVLIGHGSSVLPPTNCVFANNIIDGSVNPPYAESSGAQVTRSQNISWTTTPSYSGFLAQDPSFTTVTENSYSLQKLSSSSPAIGAADTSYFPYVTTDMDGQTRSSFDIGADEYSTASVSITPLTTSDVGPASGGGIIGGGGPLPSGWTDADIGSVGVVGSASYDSGTFTLNGSGNDIWGTSDAFNYAYQSVSGDQTIVARVASQQNTSSWAKSGVMFRDSTAADAAYVGLYVTPGNGVSMQSRPSNGASAIDVARQTGLTAPYWVKLVRSGSTFTGYISADGSTWVELAATNATIATAASVGLADCAHDNTVLNTSTFDNVSITASAPADFSLSASPGSLSIVQGNNGTSTIAVNPVNGFNGSVSLSASGLPAGVIASFNPSSTTTSSTLTLTASSTATTGTATVTITGTSGNLTHTTTVNLTVNPAPDFSLSASPNSLTITQANNGTSTITVNPANGFNSSVNLSASGLRSGVTASFNPLSTTTSSTLTLTASSTAATGTATVTVTGTSGSLTHTTTISLTVNASSGGPLPTGWTDVDVGAVGLAGSASYNNGTFTVSGSGADIWTAADQFNYAYQSVSGDQTIVARVVSETGTASFAKAGVMIREALATNSVEASVLLTPTNGVAMEIRPTTGAASINVTGWIKGIAPLQWLKLVRSGNTFTGYYSADGSTWTQIASTNVTMASSETIGLAITSHDNTSLNTATFDNVSVTGGGNGIDTTTIYKIQNEASGLVLDQQGSLTNGSAITQWSSSSSSQNLQWTFIPTSNGYYQINSVKSGLDAVVQGASMANGAGIIQWSLGSSGNDQWLPQQNSDGSYTFVNLHSGLVLEDPGSSTSTSTQMDQWSSNGGSNQKWILLRQ